MTWVKGKEPTLEGKHLKAAQARKFYSRLKRRARDKRCSLFAEAQVIEKKGFHKFEKSTHCSSAGQLS